MQRIWLILVAVLAGGLLRAAELTAGDLTVTLDERLTVQGLRLGGQAAQVRPAPLLTLWASDTAQTAAPQVAGGSLTSGQDLTFTAARATARLTVTPVGQAALRFRCVVTGQEGPDRGLLLRFALPLDAVGWQWHEDLQTARGIGAGETCENVVPLRAYADLPEWQDRPALRMGYANRNFCTVITPPVAAGRSARGLVAAVPIDQPRMFRTAYDAAERRLELTYDFALSALTRRPYEADFEFVLYTCDAAWGLRSALQRYYALFPEPFKVHVREQGMWMAFNRLSEIDNANEFGFGLQEGAPEPQYDDQLGVLDCNYYTHAGIWGNLPPPYDPEKDPLPPLPEQVKAINETFRKAMGQEGVYDAVGTRKPDGTLAVEKWSVYAHLLAQFNLDPELPYGKWLVEGTRRTTDSTRQRTNGGELDGFYYDGLTSGLNYAREHFRTTDTPLLWDPARKQAFLNNFFSSIEFARATAEFLRPQGQVTMMNGGMGESFYVVPWLDVLGAETGLMIPRRDFNFVRASLHHKPFMTLLKGDYERGLGRPEMELFMQRCLAYGVYPGFFDWPPSGLGPGGQYWNHPAYYERDRDLHRKYQPLCKALALAGWEPLTHARSSDPLVFVERFGSGPLVWLTLLNEQAQPRPTTLTVDAAGLGLDPRRLRVTEITSGQTLATRATAPLQLEVTVPPAGVLVLQLGSPAAVAAWHLGQAVTTVDQGVVQRRVDAAKPPLATHWRPTGAGYTRQVADGRSSLVLPAAGSARGLRQWVMLFQPAPAPLRLQATVSARDLTAASAAKIQCRLAWVTPNYSYYQTRDFALPDGTWEHRELSFEITAEQALRAIELLPAVSGKGGEVRFERLSIVDGSGQEYVRDPDLTQWYEPFPAALREAIDPRVAALRSGLASLQQRASGLTQPAFRQELAQLCGRCRTIEQAIDAAQAQHGGRRVRRDLERVKEHLSQVTLASYGLPTPAISGPSSAAPGDTVILQFAPPQSTAGLPPVRAELQADPPVTPLAGGGRLVIPANAQPGATVLVQGLLHLGRPGEEATLRSSHAVRVVEPLEVTLQSSGCDATSGAARVQVTVRNNRLAALQGALTVTAPAGWSAGPARAVTLPPTRQTVTEVLLSPTANPLAGPVELTARLQAGADTAQARLLLLYIPPQANLLRNPGFEDGRAAWGAAVNEAVAVDRQVCRSGQQALRLHNPTRRDNQASQTVTLNQQRATPVLVQVSSKAEGVEGPADRGYCLYVDIYFTDGTPWYGLTHTFATGSTDWQLGELYLEPAKPIKLVNVYLLLRNKIGRVWFDDVAVMEDPRRRGNLARDAQVTVDSSYSGYSSAPVHDGLTVGTGLHWTQEAWASADTVGEHWIELQFPQPVTLDRALVYWSLDAGLPRTSREVQWQVLEGGQWRTLATATNPATAPQTAIQLAAPQTGQRFRFWQPAGRGSDERPNLLWVRELEVFAPPGG
ncbi:MAG: hypothetical protein IT204_23350 [Fimbriimonadaceae bacterium]|nr:hypothetical protein [Fimbriimonadaceae bacterium]